jgi:hypothetical protein
VEDRGLELALKSLEKQWGKPRDGAKSGAVAAQGGAIEADLAAIIAAWPTLPEAVRRQMAALVREAADGATQ